MPNVLPRAGEYAGAMLDQIQGTLGVQLDRREGSRWDALAGMFAAGFVRAQQIVAVQFDAQILDRAVSTDVDAYCTPRGPVRRFGAAAAKGTVTLHRTLTSPIGTIPGGTEIRVPSNGSSQIFVTAQDWNVGGFQGVVVPVVAQAAGAEGNVGTVTDGLALTGLPAPLFDLNLLPTSITVGGGAAGETDDELKARQRLWEQSRQRATPAAVAFGALLVNGVKHAVAVSFDSGGLGARGILYVGDVNWSSTPTMFADVAASIETWRPFGPSLPIAGFETSAVSVTATIRMARAIANYNVNALISACSKKALDYFNTRVDPYSYDLGMLQGRIARANDEIAAVELASPVASVASPLSPSALALEGFPASLTRYSLDPSAISLSFTGPQ